MAARYLYGDTAPLMLTIATAKAVNTGDIIGVAANTVITAADQAWNTSLAQTQQDFAALFVGLSGQTKAAGTARPYGNTEDNLLRVDTAGEFEIDCVSGTYEVGDWVGPAKDVGNALLANKVDKVAAENQSIGRVTRRGTSITKVTVRLTTSKAPLARKA